MLLLSRCVSDCCKVRSVVELWLHRCWCCEVGVNTTVSCNRANCDRWCLSLDGLCVQTFIFLDTCIPKIESALEWLFAKSGFSGLFSFKNLFRGWWYFRRWSDLFWSLMGRFMKTWVISSRFVAQTDKSWSRSHQVETPSSPSTSPSPPILQVKMTICPQCFYSRDGICRINVFKTIGKKNLLSLCKEMFTESSSS